MTRNGSQTAVIVERNGPLGIISLNRPDQLNAIDAEMRQELPAAMNLLIEDDEVKAILLTGSGRAFCAGADLRETIKARAVPNPAPGGDLLREIFNPLIMNMISAAKPIVVAVNGPAIGFGCSLALAADLVIAAKSATFSMAFTRLGAIPDGGATWVLPRILGGKRAMAMMMLGQEISALQAEQWGIVSHLLEDRELSQTAREIAGQLANGPTLAYAGVKALTNASAIQGLAEHLALEADWQDEAFETSEFDAALSAFAKR